MITPPRHETSESALQDHRGVFELYDIVFGIGHSETLYHRPGGERDLPKAKTLRQIFD